MKKKLCRPVRKQRQHIESRRIMKLHCQTGKKKEENGTTRVGLEKKKEKDKKKGRKKVGELYKGGRGAHTGFSGGVDERAMCFKLL